MRADFFSDDLELEEIRKRVALNREFKVSNRRAIEVEYYKKWPLIEGWMYYRWIEEYNRKQLCLGEKIREWFRFWKKYYIGEEYIPEECWKDIWDLVIYDRFGEKIKIDRWISL